jgi:hypothetical protein
MTLLIIVNEKYICNVAFINVFSNAIIINVLILSAVSFVIVKS